MHKTRRNIRDKIKRQSRDVFGDVNISLFLQFYHNRLFTRNFQGKIRGNHLNLD